jgi:hypothetical protein
LTDANGKMLVNFGDVAGQRQAKFEEGAINNQYGWRGWFNGKQDHKELSEEQRRTFSAAAANAALIERPSDLFFSAPYKSRVDGIWVMTISRRLTPFGGGPSVAVLSGQFAFEQFVDFIKRFESSVRHQRRKVVVANELGEAMYHSRLVNSADSRAAALETEHLSKDAPEVSPQSKDYGFFVSAAFTPPNATDPVTRADPWEVVPAKEYFIGREVLALDLQNSSSHDGASGPPDGQKLAVFVIHEKDRALQGLNRAKWTAFSLGFGVLLMGGLFLMGNLWGLRRTLNREEFVEHA